ncbi:MAG: DUF349 domain-containing protein [Flavobacteriales bacterium]|nr:DUF349 domain-containing protein [Flavobacteriales bacterium]
MATKAELIGRLEETMALEDVEQAAEIIETLKENYEALVATTQENAEGQDDENNGVAGDTSVEATAVPIESAPLLDEEDKRFKQLLDAFNQRVNDIRRKKAKEEADNLKAKQAIMEELKGLIAGEENIGTAFQRFSELQESWKTIGPVPQQSYRDLQNDYSHLRDEFFYHIRIYKELRDHDLRKNTALKQALVSDVQSLAEKDNVKELESAIKDYQEKWHHIGPVVREEWEAIRDAFSTATRVVYDKIHEYYKARRSEHEGNLDAKKALVEKVQLLTADIQATSVKEWQALTDQVLDLQNAWKAIGFATKKDNERIWKEFRSACNVFFDAKKAHFDALREQYKAVRDRKQALLDEAVALKDSTEWRQTADRLKRLQHEWKDAGSAGPRDENRLWSKFREACDHFFQARKSSFEKLDEEQAVNAKAKEELLAEIEGMVLSGDRTKDIEGLKAFSMRWMNSGRVSPKLYDAFSERYRAALDKHYGQLKMEGDERRKLQFNDRMEVLKSAPDGQYQIEKESRFIKRKIEELESERISMENSMGMFNFKSASGAAMKADMEKKIDRLTRDVERLKGQHKELLKELK